MLKKQIGLCLLVVLGLLNFGASRAAVISFDPVNQTVVQGNTASVDLVISGLGPDPTGFDTFLSTFDLKISFDDSILRFQSFTIGPGPTGLDPLGFFGNPFINGMELMTPDTIFVQDLSLETDSNLQLFQPGSFDLGTIVFDTVGNGTSALTITSAILGGETDPLTIPFEADLETGSITVSAIPVPAAAWLFASGLIGLIGFGKHRKFLMQS